MTYLPCTVVATIERVPPPSEYILNPLYVAEAEERAKIVAEEKLLVKRLRTLMRKEAQLKKKIYQTRSRFNTVASISRLPAEALSTIFEALVSDHWKRYYPLVRPSRSVRAYQVTPYEWIKAVLHVCRQWRSVALSTPHLWTCIAHDRLYQTWRLNFLLEHSGNLPLTLRNDQSLDQDPDDSSVDEGEIVVQEPLGPKFFEFVLRQFQRIEVLAAGCSRNVCSLGNFVDAKKDEDGALDAPLVRHLMLDLSQTGTRTKTMLFNINMPGLRTLLLSNAPLELVQRLSSSSLTSFDVTLEDDVDTTTLLDLFENLPALRQLSVDCITSDDSSDVSRGIPLRDLELLRLEGTAHGVTQLLKQLIFPASTVIELETAQGLSTTLLASIMPTILGHTASRTGSPKDTARAVQLIHPHTITLTDGGYTSWDSYVYTRVYFWYTLVSTTTTPIHSETGNHAESNALCTRDSSWYKAHKSRLLLIQPADSTSLPDQMAVLDTSELLSLTIGPVFVRHLSYFCGMFQRPGFPKLDTLCISADRDRWLPLNVLKALSALATTCTSPVLPEPVESSVEDGPPSSNHPTSPPSTYFPLPALETVILHRLTILFKGPGDNEVNWRDGDIDIYAQLRCCVQLGFKFRLLRLTDVYLLASKTTAAGIVRDALLELGIADEVEVTEHINDSR
ncbi:hypothetical protein EIP86_007299 [Pleurotus ostreatoroseus]|nr:hypothetical protein EIP86_007299 [Pleurotus ostreatoroseus]